MNSIRSTRLATAMRSSGVYRSCGMPKSDEVGPLILMAILSILEDAQNSGRRDGRT
jgi:hypothetical protein